MAIKISKKIVKYALLESNQTTVKDEKQSATVIQLGEPLVRPDKLVGNTYKIKTPVAEYALYITINDIVMAEGTPQEHRRPFEIFINSKNMEHFQWIVALTRVMSAVFRKGGDVTFLVEELRSVFEPSGGYFKKGGKFMPSLVAEIGGVLEHHLCEIGMLSKSTLDVHQQKLVAEKRQAYSEHQQNLTNAETNTHNNVDGFPQESKLCIKCHTKAVVVLDNCLTCLSCGDSKCG